MNVPRPSLRDDSFVSFVAGILVAALMLMGGPTAYAAAVFDGGCCDGSPPLVGVQEVAPFELTPTEQVVAAPENILRHVLIIDEMDMPEGWAQPVSSTEIAASQWSPATTLTISPLARVVAVVYQDAASSQPRYGCGIRTEVTIVNSGNGAVSRAGSFKLIRETANGTEAVAAMQDVWDSAAQSPSAGIDPEGAQAGGGPPGSIYSLCVSLCLTQTFNERWAVFEDCLAIAGLAAAAVAAACCQVCLLGNVVFWPCMTACLGELALALGVPIAMLTGVCFADLIASLIAAQLVCRLGCIGV
ncbi:MAG: hypothetical protein IT434_15025 [Phycisphaerales bacterium]|nr:hypothetical protein [Phycisphaerales bacterium]